MTPVSFPSSILNMNKDLNNLTSFPQLAPYLPNFSPSRGLSHGNAETSLTVAVPMLLLEFVSSGLSLRVVNLHEGFSTSLPEK